MAASQPPTGERRRSPRVLRRLPVHLSGEDKNGQRVDESAEAVVINDHGALVKTGNEFRPGSDIELENPENRRRGRFRVIWARPMPLEGKWDIGVELNEGEKPPWAGKSSA